MKLPSGRKNRKIGEKKKSWFLYPAFHHPTAVSKRLTIAFPSSPHNRRPVKLEEEESCFLYPAFHHLMVVSKQLIIAFSFLSQTEAGGAERALTELLCKNKLCENCDWPEVTQLAACGRMGN